MMDILLKIILPSVGFALVLYSLYIVLIPEGAGKGKGPRKKAGLTLKGVAPQEEQNKFSSRIAELESELAKVTGDYSRLQKEAGAAKRKEAQLSEELKRREEWVAKSESVLNKVKEENLELKKKFISKEKESEAQFSQGVTLNRQIRELNEKARSLENEIKERSDKIEAQKHEIERRLKEVKMHQEIIAKLKKKEEISEWVPKEEFNKLNEEYTALEKELEEKEERL